MQPEQESSFSAKIRRKLIGAPRDLHDSSIFHKISLIPILAWIGLGADRLSPSAYGPEEAFRALGEHPLGFRYVKLLPHFRKF